jgi:hypothetical protein
VLTDLDIGHNKQSRKVWEIRRASGYFECYFSYYLMSFSFHNRNMQLNDLKKDAINKFGIEYRISYLKDQISVRRVWRYQSGNQNPYIEEEQTTQWPKEKVQKDKRSTKHTHKIKDQVTRTPLKTGDELSNVGVLYAWIYKK